MKKKILSLAILVSVLVMSIPQNVYAGMLSETGEVTVYIGQTYTDILLGKSSTKAIDYVSSNSELPKDLTVRLEGARAYLVGKVSDEIDISDNKYWAYIQETINNALKIGERINIKVEKGRCDITEVPAGIEKNLSDGSFTLHPVAKDMSDDDISGGTYSYKSSNTNVATVDNNGTVTLRSVGTTVIHVTFEKNGMYEGEGADCTLTVTDDSSPSTPDSDQNQTIEAPNPFVVYLQTQSDKISNTKAGDTVIIESKSDLSLPLWFMKELQDRKDITRKLSYNYKGLHYEITIPSGQAFVLDDTIPWYGPLKLSAMFGAEITPIK